MAALNIFGKKKTDKAEPTKTAKPAPTQSEKKEQSKTVRAEKEQPVAAAPEKAVILGDSYLVRPHITEKATDLAAKNQYVFVVKPTAAKKEIGKSVEEMYGVKVQGVRIVTVHPKSMRLGRTKGVKQGYKKAIVKIKEGQSIEILPT
jgi:large subunit ribosomal protein L23